MKKLLNLLFIGCFVLGSSVTASAADQTITNEDPGPKSATIETTIAPTYTVSVPGDTTIEYGVTSTTIGEVRLIKKQIEPEHIIKVELSHENNMSMKHKQDSGILLPYTCNIEAPIVFDSDTKIEARGVATPQDAFPVKIDITTENWESSILKAGSYEGKITFTVTYGPSNPS